MWCGAASRSLKLLCARRGADRLAIIALFRPWTSCDSPEPTMKISRRQFVAITAFLAIAIGLSCYVIVVRGRAPTPAGVPSFTDLVSAHKFVVITPPSSLYLPGTVVERLSESPLALKTICTPNSGFGPACSSKYKTASCGEISMTRQFSGDVMFDLGLPIIWSSTASSSTKTQVAVRLTNLRVTELPPGECEAGLAISPCKEEVASRRKENLPLTVIQAVLIGDISIKTTDLRSVHDEIGVGTVEELAAKLSLSASSTDRETFEGKGLVIGIRDDTRLLQKVHYVATGAGSEDSAEPLLEVGKTALLLSREAVHHNVRSLKQGTPMGCWATVLAMLVEFQMSRGGLEDFVGLDDEALILAVLSSVDALESKTGPLDSEPSWVEIYKTSRRDGGGLTPARQERLLRVLPIDSFLPQSVSLKGWLNRLRDHGPLWITTGSIFSTHARLLIGMGGDGDETWFEIIDPASGTRQFLSLRAFIEQFERENRELPREEVQLRNQILYWNGRTNK